MRREHFDTQINRLKVRFGQKAFDPEFIQLLAKEVFDMSEHGFTRFCDVLIGSRTANKPPLLSEFREARINEQKIKFDNEAKGAAQTLRRAPGEMKRHLRSILHQDYGGVEKLTDALEIARIRRRTDGDDGGAA